MLAPRPHDTSLPSARKLPAAGVLFALGVALVLACNSNGNDEEDDNQFRDDVIWCEEAIARLERCCPGFDGARVECKFYYSYNEGCGSSETRRTEPAFTKDESRCIHDTTCSALVDTGVCARAAQNGSARSSITSDSTSSSGTSGTSSSGSRSEAAPPRPTVCP